MISYGRQSIDQSDIDAVVDVLNGDWLTQGPAVETFENDLKLYFGARHACAVANGTAALQDDNLERFFYPQFAGLQIAVDIMVVKSGPANGRGFVL